MKKGYGRNSLQYKMSMFAYNITWHNFKIIARKIGLILFEALTLIAILFIVFILPAFFH